MKRKLVIIGSALAATSLVALGALALFLPAERIGALAAERAEAAIGRAVAIERVDLDLFPTPGVALEGVEIAGRTADAPPLATVRRAVLRPKLLPLLARRVVVDVVRLEEPRLLVVIDSAGVSNLPLGTAAERAADAAPGVVATAQADEAAVEDRGVAFLVDRFEIAGGRIGYVDARTGNAVRLDGVDQRLRLAGELQEGELASIRLEGDLSVDSLGAVLPGALAVPIRNLRLRLSHDALLDRTADSLSIERLAVELQEVALEGSATVRRLSESAERTLTLDLAAGPVDLAALVASLPAALIEKLAPAGEGLPDVGGRAVIRVAADGPLGDGELPAVDGTLELESVRLANADHGELIDGLGGRIEFSLDSASSESIDGRLLGEPLHLSFTVRDFAQPVADARLRAALDLERAAAAGLVPDSLGTRGTIHVDLATHATLLAPEEARIDGSVELAGVEAAPPSLRVPVRVASGRLAFDGQRVESEALRLMLGESDLAVDLTAEDWLPLALGDSAAPPVVTVDARSRLLDVDAILPAKDTAVEYGDLFFARLADRPVDGRAPEEVAEAAGFGIPALPPVRLEGRYRAARLRRNGLDFEDVDVAFRGDGRRIDLSDANFQLMGGGVQISGRLGLPADGGADAAAGYPMVFSYQLRDVGAAPFFDRLTPFRDHLAGSMLLAGTVSMTLDANLLPIRETVLAEGTIALSDGRLANWPVLDALGGQLGLAAFDTLTFRDWAGEFRITGPRVTLRESAIESDELDASLAGAFDFAGRLELAATLELSPTLAGRVRGTLAPRLTAAAAGGGDAVPIGIRITGPATAPDIRLDLSEAADNVVAEAREEAEERAREWLGGALEQAAGRLFGGGAAGAARDTQRVKADTQGAALDTLNVPRDSLGRPIDTLAVSPDSLGATVDSLALPADSARAQLQDALRERLRRMLRIKH